MRALRVCGHGNRHERDKRDRNDSFRATREAFVFAFFSSSAQIYRQLISRWILPVIKYLYTYA
jgi:hypothetical protein